MITNQLKEHIIQGWLLYVIRSWFPFFTSFHLAEASPSTFSSLYTLVCAVVQKYHKTYFIYNYSHFWYSFCNQPVLLARLENVNKLWNNNHAHRNQNKNKTKLRHIKIDHALYCSIQPTNNSMVSLKDGFTVWRQSQKEDFLSIRRTGKGSTCFYCYLINLICKIR